MELKKATFNDLKLRIGLSGASGFGKTYSSLLLAYGITNDWSKIAVIDSENGSSNLYSKLGDFRVLQLNPPYSPENYIKAVRTCENASIEVIIIDSITHEWKGFGGCLDMHRKLGGRFQDWNKVTPEHFKFIEAIQKSTCHIITTVRRKIEYALDTNSNGRLIVKKLGTKEETRNGFEYELTLNFEFLNENHLVKATKDRTSLFTGKPEFVINKATGKKLRQWLQLETNKEEILKQSVQLTG
jgi:hypothetical protein